MSQVRSLSSRLAMSEATALGVIITVPPFTLTLVDRSSVSWLVFGPTIAGTWGSSIKCVAERVGLASLQDSTTILRLGPPDARGGNPPFPLFSSNPPARLSGLWRFV